MQAARTGGRRPAGSPDADLGAAYLGRWGRAHVHARAHPEFAGRRPVDAAIINPLHPDYARVVVGAEEKLRWDERLMPSW